MSVVFTPFSFWNTRKPRLLSNWSLCDPPQVAVLCALGQSALSLILDICHSRSLAWPQEAKMRLLSCPVLEIHNFGEIMVASRETQGIKLNSVISLQKRKKPFIMSSLEQPKRFKEPFLMLFF